MGIRNASLQARDCDRGLNLTAPAEWNSHVLRRAWKLKAHAYGLKEPPVAFYRTLYRYRLREKGFLKMAGLCFRVSPFDSGAPFSTKGTDRGNRASLSALPFFSFFSFFPFHFSKSCGAGSRTVLDTPFEDRITVGGCPFSGPIPDTWDWPYSETESQWHSADWTGRKQIGDGRTHAADPETRG